MASDNAQRALSSGGTHTYNNVIALTGVNHKNTEVALRERFAVSPAENVTVLTDVLAHPSIDEAVVVSTCNRTEIILATAPALGTEISSHIEKLLEHLSGVPSRQFTSSLYHLHEEAAVAHVFRVAAGLDSMIVGEPQVLGQLKTAYQAAQSRGATRALLNRLFHRAFGVAKAVRTRTSIGQHAVSVCYAAKELAEQIFGDLSEASVMLIGAGETGTLALKHLKSAGARQFFIVNKTLSKASDLATAVGGAALDLSSFGTLLHQADIIIGASTLPGGTGAIVTRALAERALKERPGQPQFYIDLGVPRNFAAEINDVSDAFLYNIDDLQGVVARNIDARAGQVQRAEIIVNDEVQKFLQWRELRFADLAIRELQGTVQHSTEIELRKTMRRLQRSGFSAPDQEILDAALRDFADALLAKTLHNPIATLKQQLVHDAGALPAFRDYFLGDGLRKKRE